MLSLVADLNERDDIDGILIQFHYKACQQKRLLEAVSPDKMSTGSIR